MVNLHYCECSIAKFNRLRSSSYPGYGGNGQNLLHEHFNFKLSRVPAITSPRSMASMNRNAKAATMDDLGEELLLIIFLRLGPSPMHLAALSCVCKQWRRMMNADVWRQLCLEAAPGFCKSMWYSGTLATPTGGWSGVYKFLLYCPGLETNASCRHAEILPGLYQSIRGHTHGTASGFQTGP